MPGSITREAGTRSATAPPTADIRGALSINQPGAIKAPVRYGEDVVDVPDPRVRALYQAIEDRDDEGVAALLRADVRWSAPASVPGGGIRVGREAVLEGVRVLFRAVPEVEVRIEEARADRDRSVVRGAYALPNGVAIGFSDVVLFDGEDRVRSLLSQYDGAGLLRALRPR